MNAVAQLVPGLFSDAEMVLIRRIHGVLPPAQLLDLLNARRVADRGAHAPALRLDQLLRTIATLAQPPAESGWSALRKLVEQARVSGVLDAVNAQVIDDFAIVYSLNARQVVTLKDILLARDGDEE
uniref:hypothetical protein n=1 Tax=Burkholderia arboris TaxID=488730 RepID=UPI003BEEDDBE